MRSIRQSAFGCYTLASHTLQLRHARVQKQTKMSGNDTIVETRSGKVRGAFLKSTEGDDYYSFKGIPYAKPPVGQLRFKDPEPAESWEGVKDATKFGNTCPQLDIMTTQAIQGDDDCLYLNVYTKCLQSNKRLPVMVWIHGGGFVSGSGNDDLYGPDYLLRKDVVLVTFNYRLGVLGFLNLEDEIAPGNQGLKDQVLALQWVRDNIANFGGDPNNVTIFGESAGGASVHYLTISPLAKGLLHKAIIQSGVVLNPWASITINPKEMAYRLCSRLGIGTRNHKEMVDSLRKVDCLKLIEIQEQLLTPEEKMQFRFTFGPGIDAKSQTPFMPVHPEVAADEGVQVPLLIGYNSQEGIIFIKDAVPNLSKYNTDFEKCLVPSFLKLLKKYNLSADEFKRLYWDDEVSNEDYGKLIDLMSDVHFVEGIHRVVKTQIERSSAPTYLYQFFYDKSPSMVKMLNNTTAKGAAHADELPCLFHSSLIETVMESFKLKENARKVMKRMTEMWVNFATTGRPTTTTSELIPVYWKPVNNETMFRYLHINEDLRMDATVNLELRYSYQKNSQCKL